MSLYGRYGTLTAKPGERDNLVQYMLQAAELVRPLEGCILYLINTLPDEPDAVWIIELWANKEAHAASLTLESVRALIPQVLPLLAGPPEGSEFLPVGGKGV
jgi:quinol monooxygenase YgiN